jgi:hypothetical protein
VDGTLRCAKFSRLRTDVMGAGLAAASRARHAHCRTVLLALSRRASGLQPLAQHPRRELSRGCVWLRNPA